MNREQARALIEKRTQEFWKRYYRQLEGATILRFAGMDDSDETSHGDGFPSFIVKLKSGEVIGLQVSQDEEGNGGGFLFGPDLPTMADWDKKHGYPPKYSVGAE